MAGKSNIEWCTDSWNPIVGCTIVSPGCTNCYAMKMAARIERMMADRATHTGKTTHYEGTTKIVNGNAVWTGVLKQAPDHILTAPLRWKKPRKIFVNSMGDLFHESVPDEWIDKVFAVMALCPQHTFQCLTKRSKRMREYMTHGGPSLQDMAMVPQVGKSVMTANTDWPLPNVWLGVSAEDQARADERIPDLLATPAAVRFVSAEPLLSAIDFVQFQTPDFTTWFDGLSWVIVGGESGPSFRPMQIEWAESIRQQCEAAGTAFFFKQVSGPRSGMRGNASESLWGCKQFPEQK